MNYPTPYQRTFIARRIHNLMQTDLCIYAKNRSEPKGRARDPKKSFRVLVIL